MGPLVCSSYDNFDNYDDDYYDFYEDIYGPYDEPWVVGTKMSSICDSCTEGTPGTITVDTVDLWQCSTNVWGRSYSVPSYAGFSGLEKAFPALSRLSLWFINTLPW